MTGRFNLLPHRSFRETRARQVLARQIALVSVVAFMSALLINGAVGLKVNYLQAYNLKLQSLVDQLVPSFQESQQLMKLRDDMLEKQQVLERLDARRSTSVLILNDVAQALPQDVYLTRLEEDGDRFRLEAKSVNSASVVRFFEAIVQSERLIGLALEEIRTQDGEHAAPYVFAINGQVKLAGKKSSSISEAGR